MELKITDHSVKTQSNFEILRRDTAYTTHEFQVAMHLDPETGKTITIPFQTFRSYIARILNGEPARHFETSLWNWFNAQNLTELSKTVSQIDKDLTENPHAPGIELQTTRAIELNTKHLSDESLAEIEANMDFYHAVKFPYTYDEEDVEALLLPVPEGIGNIPDDIRYLYNFAWRMQAAFLVLKDDAPMYNDIYTESNFGDRQITPGVYYDGQYCVQ